MENTQNQKMFVRRTGVVSAYLAILVGILEISINFLPAGKISPASVQDWVRLFQNNWFVGLRDLGLLNIALTILGLLVIFSIYEITREENNSFATLALIVAVMGGTIYIGTNKALPMMEMSRQYMQASTEAQRTSLMAAGQTFLLEGTAHTPGTFIGLALNELAFVLTSFAILSSKKFGRGTAIAGMIGFGALLINEIIQVALPTISALGLLIAMIGGIISMIWYFSIARALSREK
jgi:hypothetical protein